MKKTVTESQNKQSSTDIDLVELSKAVDPIYLNLKISTRGYAEGTSTGEPGHERANLISLERQYTVNPTLPIGKLATVYSSVDAANNTKVEIQMLVKPICDK